MSQNTTSFKPFWIKFHQVLHGIVKKMNLILDRSPISLGIIKNESNIRLGWEFNVQKNDNFDGFRIILDCPNDPFDWFMIFVKESQDVLKKYLAKQKVDISQFKVLPPKKIVFMTLRFDPTPRSILLGEEALLQKCIQWGKDNSPSIIKASQKFTEDFVIFIAKRCSPDAYYGHRSYPND